MKKANLCVTMMVVAFAIAASASLHAQEADATFKTGVAQLYKDWILGRPFLIAYDVHSHSVVKGSVGPDIHHEVRVAWDAATKRVVWEQHDWPVADEPAMYYFYRWDGAQMMRGNSAAPRALNVGGKPVTRLVDAPLGMPLCTTVTIRELPAAGVPQVLNAPFMMPAGLALDGKSTEVCLEEMLKDPKARLEHLEGSGVDDLTLSLLDKRIVFDARLGLIKETQGFGGNYMRRVVHKFANRMPVEITLIEDFTKEQAQNLTEYKAFPGQCRVLTAQEFEDLIHLEIPSDMLVRQGRRGPVIVAPANGK